MQDAVSRLNAALTGRYEIERELGRGGMATVYLARDLRHERKVALKVLKPELAAVVGAERFLAEIRTTANLQHPHILPLYDSGEADGLLFYVMPHVEGESLRERLDREHQLPVDEAVRIATNVASALDYAHRHGVIHRDIKPANILLLDGEPVVSDFGIALAVSAGGAGRLTETGLSLGTPHYMSPEQATGDASVGPATDVWALGCVLYEMLVGEPPYTGSTPQAVLGKIITAEPTWASDERRSVPPSVDATIRKALEKVPADRFGSAADFMRALADSSFRHRTTDLTGHIFSDDGGWKRIAILASAVATVSLLLLAGIALSRPEAPPAAVVRVAVPVGEGAARVFLGGVDGQLLVYAGWEEQADGTVGSRLYMRPLQRQRADPIPGTERASNPFFSADGRWVAFFAGDSLRRIPVTGGEVETLVTTARVRATGRGAVPRGAAWGDDGSIVYGGRGGLYYVPGGGGVSELLVEEDTLPPRLVGYAQPHFLPGGRTVLFHGRRGIDPASAEIMALDLESRSMRSILPNAMDPRYLESGHLLFMREGTLMAVSFDSERVQALSEPIVIEEDVMHAVWMPNNLWSTGAAQLSVSRTGHVAYVRGGVYPEASRTVVRIQSDGRAEPVGIAPQLVLGVRAAPEGGRLAFAAGRNQALSVFVYDMLRGVSERIGTGGSHNGSMEWSPDGSALVFSSDREDLVWNVYRLVIDGSGEPERLAPSTRTQTVSSVAPDGTIAYLEGGDIWILPPGGQPSPLFTTDSTESHASFSADGRWIAYESNQSGRSVVYVRPFPGPGAVTPISDAGGTEPAWSPQGTTLYFVQRRGPGTGPALMAVELEPASNERLRASRPVPVVDPWPYRSTTPMRSYDVLPDGSFVAIALEGATQGDSDPLEVRLQYGVGEIQLVLNFIEELRRRVPD